VPMVSRTMVSRGQRAVPPFGTERFPSVRENSAPLDAGSEVAHHTPGPRQRIQGDSAPRDREAAVCMRASPSAASHDKA